MTASEAQATAWIATHESGCTKPIHFAASDGWKVEAVLYDPSIPSEKNLNEYICKCGVRVAPHRCHVGEEF